MKKSLGFTPELRKLRFPLIKLSENFKIIDKNIASENKFRDLRRGSDFKRFCLNKSDSVKLENLGKSENSLTSFYIKNQISSFLTLALRLKQGEILLIFHPLFTSSYNNPLPLEHFISPYSDYISALFEENYCCNNLIITQKSAPKDLNSSFIVKQILPLSEAVKIITSAFEKSDFKKNILLTVDSSVNNISFFTDISKFSVALTEMLAFNCELSPKSDVSIKISADKGFVSIAISGKATENIIKIKQNKINLISSLLSSMGIELTFSTTNSRSYVLGASLPLEAVPYHLREPYPVLFTDFYLPFVFSFYNLLIK